MYTPWRRHVDTALPTASCSEQDKRLSVSGWLMVTHLALTPRGGWIALRTSGRHRRRADGKHHGLCQTQLDRLPRGPRDCSWLLSNPVLSPSQHTSSFVYLLMQVRCEAPDAHFREFVVLRIGRNIQDTCGPFPTSHIPWESAHDRIHMIAQTFSSRCFG